ncbi:RnfABCDGE type electron transport complex subunit B [Deferribacter abyssi]|uniref:RnfABCDGE type electron transport complex subunit B n=1 Tax=Deferribacter abyssi TaxID=213806 RepID=UPI003C1DC444
MIEAIIVVGASGFAAGFGLLLASKKFSVEKDPRIEDVNELLPGANCGGCGYPGCSALAEAIVSGDTPPTACPVGGAELAEKIGELLGLEVGTTVKKVAKIKCKGGHNECPSKYDYYGPLDCHAIVLLGGGNKGCIYGCVGGGSCVKACNFDALKMGENGIPVVDEDKCTACGLCVKACPRNLIELIDVEKRYLVTCSSKDKGVETKKVCSVGCIACRLCAKNCPVDAIMVENNVAFIQPEKCTNCGKCEEVCPTKAIVRL